MQRQYVNSSNIVSIGYDPLSQVLEVEFKDGSLYHYLQVPPSNYKGIMQAESHGKYLNQYIKPFFTCTRILQ